MFAVSMVGECKALEFQGDVVSWSSTTLALLVKVRCSRMWFGSVRPSIELENREVLTFNIGEFPPCE